MPSNQSNLSRSTLQDQSLGIVENYIEVMTIISNTQSQLSRQQQTIIRRMNTLVGELRRQQAIDLWADTIRNSSTLDRGSRSQNTNTVNNSTPDHTHSGRGRATSGFSYEPRSAYGRSFRPSPNSQSRSPSHRTRNNPRNHSSTNTRSFNRIPTTSGGSLNATQQNTSDQDEENDENINDASETHANTSETNPLTPHATGMVLSFEPFLQFGNRPPSLGNIFENVPVFPSAEQIETATSSHHFQDISDPINTSCPITMEIFSPQQIVMRIDHCNHLFNPVHLHSWFRSHVRCPVCRYDIRDTTSNVDNSSEHPSPNDINNRNENDNRVTGNGNTARSRDNLQQQSSDDDIANIAEALIHALATPSSVHETDTVNQSSTTFPQTFTHTTTLPLSWTHLIPSMPLSPMTVTQPYNVSGNSTGSINTETEPSPGSDDDEFMSQD